MCEYMEYTIKATVLFSGTYQWWFGKIKEFSVYTDVTCRTIAISEDEAIEFLRNDIDKQCSKFIQRGELHFGLSDEFYASFAEVSKLKTVNGFITDFSVSVDDPRKWSIKKVIDRCTVEQAVAIFGERCAWLLGLMKNVEE